MAPDHTILHLVGNKMLDPLSMLMACTLLSLGYASAYNVHNNNKEILIMSYNYISHQCNLLNINIVLFPVK